MTIVRVRRTEKMMKMQPSTSLWYLASGVYGCQDDVIVPVGRLHPGSFQCGSWRVVQETWFPIQLLCWPHMPPPREGPSAQANIVSAFWAVHQQPAGRSSTVVCRERWHGWGRFACADIWCAPSGGGWRGFIIWGRGFVGGPVDEAFKVRFGWGTSAPHHHCDFTGTVSKDAEKIQSL